MGKELEKLKTYYEEKYFNPDTADRIRRGVHKRLKIDKNHRFRKRLIYICSAMVVFIGLFISSAFVSPTMAKVLDKVPYLNQIIKSMNETDERNANLQDFFEEVNKTIAQNKEYKGKINVAMSRFFASDTPTISIWVENKSDKQDRELTELVKDMAQKYKIGRVIVEIQEMDKGRYKISDKSKELFKQEDEVTKIAQEVLKQKGYKILVTMFDPKTKTLSIKVEGTATHQGYDQLNKIEKLVSGAIYDQQQLNYKVEIKKRSKSEITDMNWQPIFTSVMDESHKQFNEVNGFAYSFHPKPLQIILKTSLSNGEEGLKEAVAIEEYARQVIEIKRKELGVEEIPYKIIIRDQKHKDIYEKSYQ